MFSKANRKTIQKTNEEKITGNSKLGKCVEKKGAIGNNKGNLKEIQTQEENNSKTFLIYPHYCPEEKTVVSEEKIKAFPQVKGLCNLLGVIQ